jgi:hypothetical protein
MDKRLTVLTSAFFLFAFTAVSGFSAETLEEILLWDGFVLTGIEGKLIPAALSGESEQLTDSNAPLEQRPKLDSGVSGWFYEFATEVNDLRVKAPAGTTLELLPSSTLEKLIADVNERSENTYRLFGWATKYRGANFIFPNYFLPVSTIIKQQPLTDQRSEEDARSTPGKEPEQQPVVNDPNDLLAIPKEIMERLSPGRIIRPQNPGQKLSTKKIDLERDTVLADRSAFLVKQNDGRLTFVLDAFGRSVRPVSLRLLPCEALELTEFRQSAIPEPVRFKIAGIVTEYKGEKYLLLHKATRVYSHGNFAR